MGSNGNSLTSVRFIGHLGQDLGQDLMKVVLETRITTLSEKARKINKKIPQTLYFQGLRDAGDERIEHLF